MPTPKKQEAVADLVRLLGESKVVVFTDYRGLSVSEITELRRRLRESGVEYHVAKNTLTLLAADRIGKRGLEKILEGPTAIAFAPGDEVQAARLLTDYVRGTRTVLKIKGGLLDTQVLDADQVSTLASLPPRAQLHAQLLGSMQAPMVGLVSVLQGNLRALANVLDARRKQLEAGGAEAPAGA